MTRNALAWCALAWTFAAAMFWAAMKSFNRCLRRMPETNVSEQDPIKEAEKPGVDVPLL